MDSLTGPDVSPVVHDTGCNCYACVVAFEPMAAALHRQYSADPERLKPWPLEIGL